MPDQHEGVASVRVVAGRQGHCQFPLGLADAQAARTRGLPLQSAAAVARVFGPWLFLFVFIALLGKPHRGVPPVRWFALPPGIGRVGLGIDLRARARHWGFAHGLACLWHVRHRFRTGTRDGRPHWRLAGLHGKPGFGATADAGPLSAARASTAAPVRTGAGPLILSAAGRAVPCGCAGSGGG